MFDLRIPRWFITLALLVTAACGGAVEPSTTTSADSGHAAADGGAGDLLKTSFQLPDDGTPNDNATIGPFCCTGTTVTVRNQASDPVGYVYFFGWKGQAYETSPTSSAAPDVSFLVSGLADLSEPSSEQVKGEVDFTADEMKPGLSRATTVGGLIYTVTLENVSIVPLSGQDYFDMGSLTARIDVTPE